MKADRAHGNCVGDVFHILSDLGRQLAGEPHANWPKLEDKPKPEEDLSLPLLDANEDRHGKNRIDFVLVFKRPDKDGKNPDKEKKDLEDLEENLKTLQPEDDITMKIMQLGTFGGEQEAFDLKKAVLRAIRDSALSREAKNVAKQFTEILDKRWVGKVSPSEVRTAMIELFCDMFSGRHGETAVYPTLFESVDEDELFVCVQMDKSVVLKYAEFSSYKVQLDREEVIKNLGIPYLPRTHSPAYVPYMATIDHLCQKWYPAGGTKADISVLRNIDVITLGLQLIESHFNLNIWKEMGVLSAFFPAHNRHKIEHMKYKLAHVFKLKYQKRFLEMRVEGESARTKEHFLANLLEKGETPSADQVTKAETEGEEAGEYLRLHLHEHKNFELLLEIRDYFGEKIAFYFGFLHHTTRYLQVLSFLAILLHVFEFCYLTDKENKSASGRIWDVVSGRIMAHWARLTFGVVLSIWLAIFVGHWKGHQDELANRWGTELSGISKRNLMKHVVIKTVKKGDQKIKSRDVDSKSKKRSVSERIDEEDLGSTAACKAYEAGKKAEQDAKKQRHLKIKWTRCSWVMTTLYALTSFTVTCCILRHRGSLKKLLHTDPDSGKPWFGIVTPLGLTSFLLTFQMQFFTRTMPYVSALLTNWEMHKIEKDYVASNAIKVMIVNFLASFSAFFYVAFVQQFIEGCKTSDQGARVHHHDVSGRYTDQCMQQLVRDMQTVFITYILLSLLDVLIPFFTVKLRLAGELRANLLKKPKEIQSTESVNNGKARPDDKDVYSFLESQAKLDTYTGDSLAGDYQQIMFPLVFVSLFGMAFPLSAAFTLILIWIQQHLDAFKLTTTYRRPPPEAASGIGTWRLQFLSYLCYMSACVNVGLSVFRLFVGATDDVHDGFVFRYALFRNLAPTSEDDETLKHYGIMVQVLVLLAAAQLLLIVVISVKGFFSRAAPRLVVERERQEKQQRRLFSEMGGKHNNDGSLGTLFMAELHSAEQLPWKKDPDYFQGIKTLRTRCPQYYEPPIVSV